LKRNSENALASLGEARIAASQGKTVDAIKVYHRAIAGSWPTGHERSRAQARFELASLLQKSGQYLEAAAVFQELVKADDRDADAYAALGTAQLALGHYPDARDAYQNALQRNPSDAASKKQLDLNGF
jgi:tetratricopeptide (TPR) repeat protein